MMPSPMVVRSSFHIARPIRVNFAVSNMDMASHLTQGEEHLRAGRTDEAVRSLEMAVESAPDDHRAVYLLALAHLRQGHETTALVGFKRALSMSPDNVTYLSDLAVAKLRLGDRSGALSDLDRCIDLDPHYSFRYSMRAFARNAAGDVVGAVEDYRRAVELDPGDPIAFNNLGMAEESLGYADSAKEHFAKADSLSGISPAPPDHTIRVRKESSRTASTAEAPPAEKGEAGVREYLGTIGSIFTDSGQRREFIDFTLNLIRRK
jgi:Flp pilus assembly protein TadD